MSQGLNWVLTTELRDQFKKSWNALNKIQPHFLSGQEAREFFKKSNLPDIDLAKIWALSDLDHDGKLKFEEFLIALYLCKVRLMNHLLPDTIPESLKNSAFTASSNKQNEFWNLSIDLLNKYEHFFSEADTEKSGKISGVVAGAMLNRSGLSKLELSKIWEMSDVNRDGCLDIIEFVIAMHLVNFRINFPDQSLPQTLPDLFVECISNIPLMMANRVNQNNTLQDNTLIEPLNTSPPLIDPIPQRDSSSNVSESLPIQRINSDSLLNNTAVKTNVVLPERKVEEQRNSHHFYALVIITAKEFTSTINKLTAMLVDSYDHLIKDNDPQTDYLRIEHYNLISTFVKHKQKLEELLISDSNSESSINTKALALINTTNVYYAEASDMVDAVKRSKFISLSIKDRASHIRGHALSVAYAIKSLAMELEKFRIAGVESVEREDVLKKNESNNNLLQKQSSDIHLTKIPEEKPYHLQKFYSFIPTRSLETYNLQKINLLQRYMLKRYHCSKMRTYALEYKQLPSSKSARNRNKALFELYHSEERYLKMLEGIIKYWLIPLRQKLSQKGSFITNQEFNYLFNSLEIIFQFNTEMCEKLKLRIKEWPTNTSLGDIFINYAPAMKIYVQYVNSYDESLATYNNLLQNREFFNFDGDAKQKFGQNLDFPALIITPAQRLPRYELLLRELIRNTEEYHKDYNNLVKAHESINELNKYIDQKKKEFDNKNKLVAIQIEIASPGPLLLIQPHRFFIHSGYLEFSKNKGIREKGKVYVMNDIMIVTRALKGEDKMKDFVQRDLKEVISGQKDLKDVIKKQNSVKKTLKLSHDIVENLYLATIEYKDLILKELSPVQFILKEGNSEWEFQCIDEEIKKEWVSILKGAIESYSLNDMLDQGINENSLKKGFMIIEAQYGHMKSGKTINVTEILTKIVSQQGGNQLILNEGSKTPLFGNPAKDKKNKQLFILYAANGHVKNKVFSKNDQVTLNAYS